MFVTLSVVFIGWDFLLNVMTGDIGSVTKIRVERTEFSTVVIATSNYNPFSFPRLTFPVSLGLTSSIFLHSSCIQTKMNYSHNHIIIACLEGKGAQ